MSKKQPAPSPRPIDTARLKAAREAADLTQIEAATAAGVAQSYWSVVEAGQREPSLTRLRAMARAVGLSVHDLIMD